MLYTEINSKFGLLLGLLAEANGFKREKNIFISKDGKRFIACRLGFVDAEKYRDKRTIECQEIELISLKEAHYWQRGILMPSFTIVISFYHSFLRLRVVVSDCFDVTIHFFFSISIYSNHNPFRFTPTLLLSSLSIS